MRSKPRSSGCVLPPPFAPASGAERARRQSPNPHLSAGLSKPAAWREAPPPGAGAARTRGCAPRGSGAARGGERVLLWPCPPRSRSPADTCWLPPRPRSLQARGRRRPGGGDTATGLAPAPSCRLVVSALLAVEPFEGTSALGANTYWAKPTSCAWRKSTGHLPAAPGRTASRTLGCFSISSRLCLNGDRPRW